MLRANGTSHHPSRQVAGYTEYIRRFHSEVLARDALVNGCVVFTRSGDASSYVQAPNDGLAAAYPVFATNKTDVTARFPQYAGSLLTGPDRTFAEGFQKGRYKQDRGFVRQIAQQIEDPRSSPFVLLDNQDQAFLLCRYRTQRILDRRARDQKRVIIVHGPPGSGKSVVAARLWASLVSDEAMREGDVVITTTSTSQNSNWVHLVERAARMGGAGGIVKKAAGYHPISTHALGALRNRFGRDFCADPVAWRANVDLLRTVRPFQSGAEDDAYLVSIVDEAHALINPEHSDGRGQFGFAPTLGPQAYHIIRSSRLSVFFMDRDQGYRDRENTAVEEIERWAAELQATVEEIDLGDAQFRCAGSKDYVDWIEMIRSNTLPHFAAINARRWRGVEGHADIGRRVAERSPAGRAKGRLHFEVCGTPPQVEEYLRARIREGFSARLLASYWCDWKTDGVLQPHQLPPALQDFQVEYETPTGERRLWTKVWNYVPNGSDYTFFVQAPPGSAMAADPLCEVGCPYVVRGFDFDYVGLLWGPDLLWRGDRWVVDPNHVFETGVRNTRSRALSEQDSVGPCHAELLKRVWQSYRILLTRPLHGLIVYVGDEETREYLKRATRT